MFPKPGKSSSSIGSAPAAATTTSSPSAASASSPSAAAAARAAARARLTSFVRSTQHTEAGVVQFLQHDFVSRAQALVSVKAATEAAARLVVAQNHQREVKRKAREQKREESRKRLVEAGRNPEAVFRARDEAVRALCRCVLLCAVTATDHHLCVTFLFAVTQKQNKIKITIAHQILCCVVSKWIGESASRVGRERRRQRAARV
jgi:hypothetical protein